MIITPILVALLISTIIAILLISLAFLLTFNQKIDLEKSSAYECGFNPFSESRHRFDIKFYLVSILFIIFDKS
jgi:NADH:ubiquinone oxidoreductase subunit 3 (subunit A)